MIRSPRKKESTTAPMIVQSRSSSSVNASLHGAVMHTNRIRIVTRKSHDAFKELSGKMMKYE